MALSRLRLRLAAGFALAFGVALALLALGALGYLWRESRSRLDAHLDAVAQGVSDAVRREALETPDSSLAFAVTEVLAEWPRTGDHWIVAHGDAPLASTDTTGVPALLVARMAALRGRRADLPLGGSTIRAVTVDAAVSPDDTIGHYRVVAFGSTEGIEEDAEALAAALGIAAPLILLLSLIGGYLLAGRALRPVRELGAAIAAIAPGDLSRRLPEANSRDEVATLSGEFNRLLERLAEAQRRNRQFVQEAAHQIRTPLTLVLGEAELERLGTARPDDPSRQALQRIGLAAQQMRRRVDDLLLLAEAEAGTTIPLNDAVELDGLVLECTDLMRARAAAAGRALALGLVEPVTVRGHAGLLREALIELLENACRYSGPGAPVLAEVRQEGTWAVLAVSNAAPPDAGVASAGRLLGLRIVTWIAEGHGGHLDTDLTGGTYRARLHLPAGDATG